MGLIEWISTILGGIVINLIASELFAWGPRLSDWLTCWAVGRLPLEMQERMREEWAGHLAALHPLSRTLAAIGFVLAAYQLRVSFDREAKGALTVREWLALKPTFVVVFTAKGALMMGRAMIKMADSGYSQKIDFREDAVIRSNLAAKANIALRRVYKRFHGSELQPTSNDRLKLSRTSSGDIVTENARRVLIFRVRQTIAKPKRPNIVRF